MHRVIVPRVRPGDVAAKSRCGGAWNAGVPPPGQPPRTAAFRQLAEHGELLDGDELLAELDETK